MFKKLSKREEDDYRAWVRDNWKPAKPDNFTVFHPVVRDEWEKMDREEAANIDNELEFIKNVAAEYQETEMGWDNFKEYLNQGLEKLTTNYQRNEFTRALKDLRLKKL